MYKIWLPVQFLIHFLYPYMNPLPRPFTYKRTLVLLKRLHYRCKIIVIHAHLMSSGACTMYNNETDKIN